MKPSRLRRSCLCACLAVAAAGRAHAASEPTQQVEIQAELPSHEEHDYADLLAAMTQFDAWHTTHPGTRLAFRLRPRKEAAVMDGLRLVIDDPVTHDSVPVDVDADGRFVLPVSATLQSHSAVVRANRTNGTLAWTVQVTRDADDPHDRRLGDIREECHLDLYAATLARGIKTPSFYAMKAVSDVCSNRLVGWVEYADHPVFAVHVSDGKRLGYLPGDSVHAGERTVIPLAALFDWAYLMRDYSYFTQELMADAGWSDETVLHLTFADDPADSQEAVAGEVSR